MYTHQEGRNLRCSRTGRVQKNQKNLRKNTIFNEHPVLIADYYEVNNVKVKYLYETGDFIGEPLE